MDSLGRMRATEEEIHRETGRSASVHKVFVRPETEGAHVDELDDGIDLDPIVVPVVEHLTVERLGEDA